MLYSLLTKLKITYSNLLMKLLNLIDRSLSLARRAVQFFYLKKTGQVSRKRFTC